MVTLVPSISMSKLGALLGSYKVSALGHYFFCIMAERQLNTLVGLHVHCIHV
jgi:hypothetical protein